MAVAKRIGASKGDPLGTQGVPLIKLALELPVKIATAHSWRFSDKGKGIAILEEVMLGTNILIVYLEQYRDIENPPSGEASIELEFFEEQINSLSTCRWKVMHLARSWEKFSQPE